MKPLDFLAFFVVHGFWCFRPKRADIRIAMNNYVVSTNKMKITKEYKRNRESEALS